VQLAQAFEEKSSPLISQLTTKEFSPLFYFTTAGLAAIPVSALNPMRFSIGRISGFDMNNFQISPVR